MYCCLSGYFLVGFKTVLRGLWTFGFVWLKIVLGSICRVEWSTNTSYPALFSHISPRGDPCRFSPSCRAQVPSVRPSLSTLGLSTSGYTAVLRITRNFLIIVLLGNIYNATLNQTQPNINNGNK